MKVIHSKRKSFALVIEKDGTLVVRAPVGATRRQIMDIVKKHQDWIDKKQGEVKLRQEEAISPVFAEGQEFWYLGKLYPLAIIENASSPLTLQKEFVLAKEYLPHAQVVFEAWYKIEARRFLMERVKKFAGEHGLTYTVIRINSARTRWGSCSSKGSLNFSWRLMMAPPVVIDYVVVHELAHLKQLNHSKAFWAEVQKMMPTYQQHRSWLKANGHRLGFIKAASAD
jgi:predicted metal-dependent hydrolase